MRSTGLLASDLLGGFECASQKRRDGIRLDIQASTGHDRHALADYRLLQSHGMMACRDGLRWHRIEARPRRYDWSEVIPMLAAAEASGMQVIWDLLHYGLPNGLDIWSRDFVERFAAFAGAAAQIVKDNSSRVPWYTPINEISFWSWCGGDTGGINPFMRGRGPALKLQLVRAAIAATAAIRTVDPRARIACAEPLIHILPNAPTEVAIVRARQHNAAQFEAIDMLLGKQAPELGGDAGMIDLIGLNFYYNNQWIDEGRTVFLGDWLYRPLADLLVDAAARYEHPLYIAETGTEGVFRPDWLRHICDQVRDARGRGIAVEGICLYPVLSHLGWDDSRLCQNGLFDAHAPDAPRTPFVPLAAEVRAQAARFAAEVPAAAGVIAPE
ncbi:beta-glucosidase [Polymorphobacter fuscus]|uniref:Beta-glucosidase n=1 Tax=Sandarakinorhabdus fusca TaxID=1439888 RepID=A0A7C9KY91_9SPHN|nr:beta-glucosidase [Polymorphobacter fuscus]KAB7645578.1 beta-glucosidase [Polymorphobacter fuscus]MQT18026.1 beta-glucosidase [Polymorphobacter fuscus]NJC08658.1 beta-glucosidase/6-phospho-beta-glucosidase/beta-galactosidase [Polymorphobacter fuscus]